MSQQKSKIIEYRADYRTPEKRSNTFSKGTKRKPYIDEKLNKTQPILNPIGRNYQIRAYLRKFSKWCGVMHNDRCDKIIVFGICWRITYHRSGSIHR